MTTRGLIVGAVLALLLAVAAAGLVLAGQRDEERSEPPPPASSELSLLIVETGGDAFAAVVGTTGGGRRHGVLVVPAELSVMIPGQGDGTVAEALGLPSRQAATAVANLLGVWVDHHAAIEAETLAAVVDRIGGIVVGGSRLAGGEVVTFLGEAGPGGSAAFEQVLEALLAASPAWGAGDLSETDSAPDVLEALGAAAGADVRALPSEEVASGIFRAGPEVVRAALVEVFGGPDREVVPVIVLNGSGAPGIGELVAEKVVPGGFRIVVNENASAFDHDETLVVVGSADDVGLGDRVRDLLGVGSVSVSVSSGIAPVTVVVGKDFTG
ncbi:MAG TPA: LytR C-terminal domain-containing protein [Actinomycetota bacterium]